VTSKEFYSSDGKVKIVSLNQWAKSPINWGSWLNFDYGTSTRAEVTAGRLMGVGLLAFVMC